MNNIVITVARGFGSGGKKIASQVAKDMGIHCYENRILTLASQMSGVEEDVFREVNEKIRGKSFMKSLLNGLPKRKVPTPENKEFVSDEHLFEIQKKIIEDLADMESCVIVGKCADWILKDRPNVISIYIEAPRPYCRKRIMERMQVDAATADRSISQTDKYRAAYYAHYTGGNYWTNPVNYDMTLNSERAGIENCVKTIEEYIRIKYPDFRITDQENENKEP